MPCTITQFSPVCSHMSCRLKMVSSLQRSNGTKPKTPTKKTEQLTMMTNSATFSRHACLASFVGRMMHLLGIINVTIHAKEAHIRPSTAAVGRRCISGSGIDAVVSDRRVITVDCVPRLSEAQEYLALGTSAALPAMDRARDSNVRSPNWETSSPEPTRGYPPPPPMPPI